MSTDYSEKLKDPRWQRKRLEALKEADFKCEDCKSDKNTLHVHHVVYIYGREPWEYSRNTLIVVCENCHKLRADYEKELIACTHLLNRLSTPEKLQERLSALQGEIAQNPTFVW